MDLSKEDHFENVVMCTGVKAIMKKWLSDFTGSCSNWWMFEYKDGRDTVLMITEKNKYRLVFDKDSLSGSYRGKKSKLTKKLPSGKFNHDTFLKIMGRIVGSNLEWSGKPDKGYENVKTFSICATGGENNIITSDKSSLPPGTRSSAYGMKKNQMLQALEEANKFLARDKQLQEEHVNNS